MAVSDWSTTADNNTSVSGINIAEGCLPSNVNNALRQIMADVAASVSDLNDADKTLKDSIADVLKGITANIRPFLVPSGTICMWSGNAGNIPAGWYLCNGQHGTPNLQDRFIVGAGASYGVGATGGSTSHGHGNNAWSDGATLGLNQTAAHNHRWRTHQGGLESQVNGNGAMSDNGWLAYGDYHELDIISWAGSSGSHAHGVHVNIQGSDHRPPYYALCYIMKG